MCVMPKDLSRVFWMISIRCSVGISARASAVEMRSVYPMVGCSYVWLAALECGAQVRVEVMRRRRLLLCAAARADVRHDGLGGLEQVRALRLQGFDVWIAPVSYTHLTLPTNREV